MITNSDVESENCLRILICAALLRVHPDLSALNWKLTPVPIDWIMFAGWALAKR